MNRRETLRGIIGMAAMALTGCAGTIAPTLPADIRTSRNLPKKWPSPDSIEYRMGMDLEENANVFEAKIFQFKNELREASIKKLDGTADNKAINEAEEFYVRGSDTLLKMPWTVAVRAMPIDYADIAGFKHLYIVVYPSGFNDDYLRFEGLAATIDQKGLQLKTSTFSMLKDALLIGWMSIPKKEEAKKRDKEEIIVFRGDYQTAANFVAVATQISFLLYAALPQDYFILGPNSNSFAYTLLKRGLAGTFDEVKVTRELGERGWRAPGFGELLLPQTQFINFKPQADKTMSGVLARALNSNDRTISPVIDDQTIASLVRFTIRPFLALDNVREAIKNFNFTRSATRPDPQNPAPSPVLTK